MRATGFCVIHAIAVMGVSWAARGGEPPAAKPPRKPPTCPRTSTAGAPRSRLKNAESTRSTRLTAIATTGRGARKAHPGGRRSPRSRSATRMPSATRGSRSGTCWKAGGSPTSCSLAFIGREYTTPVNGYDFQDIAEDLTGGGLRRDGGGYVGRQRSSADETDRVQCQTRAAWSLGARTGPRPVLTG